MMKFFTRKNFSLFLLNLIPLFGVLYLDWKPVMVVMLYLAETILIGLLHMLYMSALYFMNRNNSDAINIKRAGEGVKGGCLVPFFLVHFGLFVFVQTMVFSGFTRSNHFNFWDAATEIFTGTYKYALITLFVVKISGMASEFLWDPEVHTKMPEDVFFQPYARIFTQQFMVILGGWFVMLGDKKFLGYLIILIVAKTVFELLFDNMNSEYMKGLLKKKTNTVN